jgi:hypothetical protein
MMDICSSHDECNGGQCMWMNPTHANHAAAAEALVRTEEVEAYIPPAQPNLPHAELVGRQLRGMFMAGKLRYFSDPVEPGSTSAGPENAEVWCSPAATLQRGGGDCDDLAIVACAMARVRARARIVTGTVGPDNGGHAWVEGRDDFGWLLIEATNGEVIRGQRPSDYRPAPN